MYSKKGVKFWSVHSKQITWLQQTCIMLLYSFIIIYQFWSKPRSFARLKCRDNYKPFVSWCPKRKKKKSKQCTVWFELIINLPGHFRQKEAMIQVFSRVIPVFKESSLESPLYNIYCIRERLRTLMVALFCGLFMFVYIYSTLGVYIGFTFCIWL